MSRNLMIAAVAFIALGSAAQAVTFTGDVDVDFAGPGFGEVLDNGGVAGDVGLPGNAPGGTVTGWDIERALFDLDLTANELNIGIDFFGIAGDADGDGGEGTYLPWLAGNGGVDLPGLAQSESICIAFDFDLDMIYDVIAGVSSWDAMYQVAVYQQSPLGQSFSFGAALPNANGYVLGSDFEMSITDIRDLIVLGQDGVTTCFNFSIFAGSIQDDGIGEDFLVGQICLTDDDQVTAVVPQSMDLLAAYPNPFNPTTTLSVELAQTGNVDLAVYNLNGQLVDTITSGMMEAGRHELTFNAGSLPSGLYLARLATEQGVQVQRLVLTK